MDEIPGTIASVDATFDGFPIIAGARWRRHLHRVAHTMRASAVDIPCYKFASLRFPHMLAPQSQYGKSSPRCADRRRID